MANPEDVNLHRSIAEEPTKSDESADSPTAKLQSPSPESEVHDENNGNATASQGIETPNDEEFNETESLVSDPNITPRRHEKARAFREARQERVEAETDAFLQSKIRKLNARAHTAQELAEKKRMHEEAKALELKKREELRADQIQRNGEVKADNLVEHANLEAAKLKAHAHEQAERALADSTATAEMVKAAEEQARRNGIAELVDEVEQMRAVGELPTHEKKGYITRLKEKIVNH